MHKRYITIPKKSISILRVFSLYSEMYFSIFNCLRQKWQTTLNSHSQRMCAQKFFYAWKAFLHLICIIVRSNMWNRRRRNKRWTYFKLILKDKSFEMSSIECTQVVGCLRIEMTLCLPRCLRISKLERKKVQRSYFIKSMVEDIRTSRRNAFKGKQGT